jgi:branched-chain amino acid transport system substrate-binding protein
MPTAGFVRHMCLVLLWITLAPCVAPAAEPIKIGFAYVFSHRLAHYGAAAKQGAELAMKEINDAGGLNGRPIVGIWKDTKLKPDVGVKVVTELIDDEKVDVLMGIVSSGVASAVAPVAGRTRTPLIITLAMTPDVTGKICNPYTFRVSQNGPQNLKGAAILAAGMNAKKWTTLGPDYLFGYQCWEYFQKYLGEKRTDVRFAHKSEISYAPVITTDFKPYIKKIMATDFDGILITLYGGNLRDFIRQATEEGFFDKGYKILMNLAYSTDVLYGMGLDMPKGLWLSGLYWFQGNETKANRAFVDAYRKIYKIFPDYNAEGAYSGVKLYAAAVEKAGTTDKDSVVKALEGITVELPLGQVTIRPEDHQAIADGVWGVTAEFDPKLRCRRLDPTRVFPGIEIARPVEDTDCRR